MFELSWDKPYKIERVTFVPVGRGLFAEIDAEDWEKVESAAPQNGEIFSLQRGMSSPGKMGSEDLCF